MLPHDAFGASDQGPESAVQKEDFHRVTKPRENHVTPEKHEKRETKRFSIRRLLNKFPALSCLSG
jgi:hypothetical protein